MTDEHQRIGDYALHLLPTGYITAGAVVFCELISESTRHVLISSQVADVPVQALSTPGKDAAKDGGPDLALDAKPTGDRQRDLQEWIGLPAPACSVPPALPDKSAPADDFDIDARVLTPIYDARGRRYRTWADVVTDSYNCELDDRPIDGVPTVSQLWTMMERYGGHPRG